MTYFHNHQRFGSPQYLEQTGSTRTKSNRKSEIAQFFVAAMPLMYTFWKNGGGVKHVSGELRMFSDEDSPPARLFFALLKTLKLCAENDKDQHIAMNKLRACVRAVYPDGKGFEKWLVQEVRNFSKSCPDLENRVCLGEIHQRFCYTTFEYRDKNRAIFETSEALVRKNRAYLERAKYLASRRQDSMESSGDWTLV
ncbi:uncharacterized protein LY89DRAFT_669234 [Mollisia scopiformis]|uniref:Uncharacterized protein n=1 Tax=Mollisia scopiformis TaxID=149040 RepID=A0A194X9C9_MOLSC|nr:uncharacterized protein LY89DRAFT_669234 [Mollisia scopiformis]KUJ16775.1 hypothetical protein LY89DRAFT_669234 [Mollisia scopiformis]